MNRYACSSKGICEAEEQGEYEDRPMCQALCQGWEYAEETLEFYINNIDRAIYLAPSDRVIVIEELTGLTVQVIDSKAVLESIATEDYDSLVAIDIDFVHWIRTQSSASLTFNATPRVQPRYLRKIRWVDPVDKNLVEYLQELRFPIGVLRGGDIILYGDEPASIFD